MLVKSLICLSHSLENIQPSIHKYEYMKQDIIHEKGSNLDKSTSMPLALMNGKKAKFQHNTMKEGRLTISLTRMLCLLCHKFNAMLSNRNWTYIEVTTI